MEKLSCIGFGIIHMWRIKLFTLCGLAAWLSVAGAASFVDQPLTYSYTHHDEILKISFPFLQADDPLVAKRINNFLHLTVLHVAPPDRFNAGEIQIPPARVGGFAMMKSDGIALLNSDRVVSVGIVTTGANDSVDYSTSYEFDTRTGRFLVKEELLTPAGLNALARGLAKERRATIHKEIQRLKGLMGAKEKKSDAVRIQQSIEIYEDCLERRFSNDRSDPNKALGVMLLGDGFLSFSSGQCASRSATALDDLGDFANKLSAEELKPYLSSFGKYILLGQGDGLIVPINPYAQIFRGKINRNIPLTLYLGSPNPSALPEFRSAKYYYDKYRTVINLSVKRKDDLFELMETDSKETPKPVLSFKVKGDRLVGEWRGRGKVYSFDAAP